MSQIQKRSPSTATNEWSGIAGRRRFLGSAAAAFTTIAWTRGGPATEAQQIPGGPATPRRYEPGADPVRYPDPDVLVLDKRFAKIKLGNAAIRRIHTGM